MLFFEVSALDSTNVLNLHCIVKVMYEHALKYGIARSSLHLANAQLVADTLNGRRAFPSTGVDVSNESGCHHLCDLMLALTIPYLIV